MRNIVLLGVSQYICAQLLQRMRHLLRRQICWNGNTARTEEVINSQKVDFDTVIYSYFYRSAILKATV